MGVEREGFGKEISKIIGSLAPGNFEQLLRYPIVNPVESHVDCFTLGQLGRIIGNANSTLIIIQYDGGGLWVAKCRKDCV